MMHNRTQEASDAVFARGARVLVVCLLAGVAPLRGVEFFVSPSGRDDWTGALAAPNAQMTDGPFASLEAARDAVRGLKSSGKLDAGATVRVRGGVYRLSKPFVLTPEDGGAPDCPIVYEAEPGETPVFSGGRAIGPWRAGVDGLWRASVPEVANENWRFRQLFVNGRRCDRAQTPNSGRYRVRNTLRPDLPLDHAENVAAGLFWPGDLDPAWARRGGVEVVFLKHWTHARLRLRSVDTESGAVSFTGPCFRGPAWSTGYFVENVREGLDEPGEWHLDWETGALTYWPLPGETPGNATFTAPRVGQLLRVEGDVEGGRFVEHVTIRGLTFSHTHWALPEEGYASAQGEIYVPAAAHAAGMRRCRFEANVFSRLGGWALELGPACRGNVIAGNTFSDIGGGGVKIGRVERGSTLQQRMLPATLSGDNLVTENRLFDGARIFLGAVAIWIGQSDGNRITGNEISGPWQFGISVGWNWNFLPNPATHNVIEGNHCHHLGAGELGCFAAIYTLGVSPGTVIRHNLIHHVREGCGIVLDEGSSGVEVVGNIIHQVDVSAFSTNFNGVGNIVHNNIFAFARQGALLRFGDAPRPGSINCNVSYSNIHLLKNGPLFRDPHHWPNFRTVRECNLYWRVNGEPVRFIEWDFDQWRKEGLDRRSRIEDPGFRDPESGDFRLPPDSPAFPLCFMPLPEALLDRCRNAAAQPPPGSLDKRGRLLGPAVGAFPRAERVRSSRADGLLFHAAFEDAVAATTATGNPIPVGTPPEGGFEYIDGVSGRALRLNDGKLCYAVDRNLSIPEGTVVFWARPVSWDPLTPGPRWRALLCVAHETTRTGNDVIQFFRYPATMQNGLFNFHCAAGRTGDSQLLAIRDWQRAQWRCIALTWSEGGATQLFLDGRLVRHRRRRIEFPGLVLTKIMLASPGTDYDELRIFNRVLSGDEIGRYATR